MDQLPSGMRSGFNPFDKLMRGSEIRSGENRIRGHVVQSMGLPLPKLTRQSPPDRRMRQYSAIRRPLQLCGGADQLEITNRNFRRHQFADPARPHSFLDAISAPSASERSFIQQKGG